MFLVCLGPFILQRQIRVAFNIKWIMMQCSLLFICTRGKIFLLGHAFGVKMRNFFSWNFFDLTPSLKDRFLKIPLWAPFSCFLLQVTFIVFRRLCISRHFQNGITLAYFRDQEIFPMVAGDAGVSMRFQERKEYFWL